MSRLGRSCGKKFVSTPLLLLNKFKRPDHLKNQSVQQRLLQKPAGFHPQGN